MKTTASNMKMTARAKKPELIGLIKQTNLELELTRYESINSKIKELEAEKEKLKKVLIKSYFEHNPTFQSKDGSLVATYLPQNRTLFDSKKFGDMHPELYDRFLYQMTCHIFTVKRSA